MPQRPFTHLRISIVLCLLVRTAYGAAGTAADPCGPSEGRTFKLKLDPFASATGYYTVDGCDSPRPVLLIQAGVEYTFDQTDITNWLHPIGFAYYPDGALKDSDELEIGVDPPGGSTAGCSATESCQSPQYYGGINGTTFLGGPEGTLLSTTDNPHAGVADGGFGLDTYEPQFAADRETWQLNKYNVKLRITDNATATLFYFCHIHEWMSGRILVSDDGTVAGIRTANGAGDVPLYAVDIQKPGDIECGTTNSPNYGDDLGPAAYSMDSEFCRGRTYLCEVSSTFGQCMASIDCQMHTEMRVFSNATNPLVTFMHQMIPHHQNAVNMAKIILKLGGPLDDELDTLMWNIINTQNMQIMQMSDWLQANGHQEDAFCKVDLGDSKSDDNDDCSTKSAEFVSLLTLLCIAAATLVIGCALYACCGRSNNTAKEDYNRKSSISGISTADMKKSVVQQKV